MSLLTDIRLEDFNKLALQRFQLIEVIAYWEGRLTTKHLAKAFGVGRQQASRDINTYIKSVSPKNLSYNSSIKGYVPTNDFTPVVTRGHVNEYLALLSFNQNLVDTVNYSVLGLRESHNVLPPARIIEPSIMRSIIRAISEKRQLKIQYTSRSNGYAEERVISPHSLVETPLRWHVRAYCEKNGQFRDFVLSRIGYDNESGPELMDHSQQSKSNDESWHTSINIILAADINLDDSQKKLVELDYGMKNGELLIPTRLALIQYTLASLGIVLRGDKALPNQQRIILKNVAEIQPLLPE